MKKFNFYCILLFTAITLFSMSSCSKDENDSEPTYTDKVVINDDGTTSNGSLFKTIDDNNFYLDNIKYTVEDDHLIVSGYAKEDFKGNAKIASSITYKQNTYEVLGIGNDAFRECAGLTSITIPNGVTSIGGWAFYVCTGLTSITIPNSVTSIGVGAFSCTGLTSITIPNSVTSIGRNAFFGCPKLEKIIVSNENTYFDSRDNCNAIILTATNTLLFGCKNSIIPNSVTNIGGGAFDCCTGLTSITIPNSVTSIGDNAFFGCSGLTSITIPNSVTSIGDYAFSGCTGLTSITIPNSVTSIGYGAFGSCTGLTSITIPNSVTSIGYSTFSGCSGLTAIHCLSSTPPTISYSDTFDNDSYSKATLYVPYGSLEAYKAAAGWGEFQNIIEE